MPPRFRRPKAREPERRPATPARLDERPRSVGVARRRRSDSGRPRHARSGKLKRIRRNPDVTVAPCKPNGRVTGVPVAARATILPADDLERAQKLIARKYRLDRVVIVPLYNLIQRLRRERRSGEGAALAITPTAPAAGR